MANDIRVQASLQDNLSGGLNQITENLGKNKKAAEKAQKSLKDMQGQINSVQSSLSGLLGAFQSGNFLQFGQQAVNAARAMGGLTGAMGAATGAAGGLGAAMTAALGPIGLVVGAIAAVGAVAYTAGKSAADLDTHLDALQALTGLDDSSMKEMSKSAIAMSKDFKASAADIVDSMKLIGSQAPELLKDKEGLQDVTEAANVLAEAGQIEVVDAAKAITTTMNQMGVAASDAGGIINTLAAASQQGSADIAYLNVAFEKSGTMAAAAGMSYTDLAAAIETIGPKFSSAEIAGSKLNALLLNLSTQTNDNFKPAVVGINQALENLAKAELTDAQMKEMVGASQVTLLKTLIDSKQTFADYQNSLAGTNTAYEMMEKNNDNLQGSITKLKSAWDAAMLALGNSSFMQGLIGFIQAAVDCVGKLINGITDITDKISELGGTSPILEALMNPFFQLTVLVKLLTETITISVAVIKKILSGFQRFFELLWSGIKARLSDWGLFEPIRKGCMAVIEWFGKMIDTIKGIWNDFKKWLGIDVKDIGKKSGKVELSKTIVEQQTNTNTGKDDKKKTKVKVKVEAEPGSIDALKKKLSDLQKTLTSKNLSLIDVQKTKGRIEEVKKQIEEKEIELGIKAKRGSLEDIETRISEIQNKIKKLDPKIDKALIIDLQIKKGELEETKKEIEEGLKPIEITVTRKSIKNIDKVDPNTLSKKEITETLSQLMSDLEQETDRTSDNYKHLVDRIKKWTAVKEKKEIEIEADLSTTDPRSLKFLDDKISKLQAKLQITPYGTEEFWNIQKQIDELTKQKNQIQLSIDAQNMSVFDEIQMHLDRIHAIDDVIGSFESLSKAIDEDANAWEIFMNTISLVESVMGAVNTIMQIGNILTALSAGAKLSDAIAAGKQATATGVKAAADQASVTTTTAATVANKALEASLLDLASASIFAAHAAIPFAGVGIATGLITQMLTTQAATHAATKAMMAFAEGGIVSGNSYQGDKLVARVNSGEMILNGRQQKNLFDAINENRLGGENSNRLYGEVKVKGQDLYIALSNFGKVKSTLGKQIGIH